MALQIPQSLLIVLSKIEIDIRPLADYEVSSLINSAIAEGELSTTELKKGFDAENYAFNFRPATGSDLGQKGIYWRESNTGLSESGEQLFFPNIDLVDLEMLEYWEERSRQSKHPVLIARYADLYWEIGKYKNKKSTVKPKPKQIPIEVCLRAIDAYLQSVQDGLFEYEFTAWDSLERAFALAVSLKDESRSHASKQAIFNFSKNRAIEDPKWMWPRFDQILWEYSNELQLDTNDKVYIIEILESELKRSSDSSQPSLFDPHLATLAADRLQRWYKPFGRTENAKQALILAAHAFESAAEKAHGILAITWLQDLILRYREMGLPEEVARIEQLILNRYKEPNNGMAKVETSVSIKNKDIEEFVSSFLKGSFEQSLRLLVAEFLLKREALTHEVHYAARLNPISAMISISLTNDQGFTIAKIGSVDDDLEGRLIHHASSRVSFNNIWLSKSFEGIVNFYKMNVDSIIHFVEKSPLFPHERTPSLIDGIQAWFDKDYIKAIHILVPQIEAACRELLRCIGGSTVKQDRKLQGFQYLGLGEVLHDDLIKQTIPSDIVFHLVALYVDVRGINLRNELAHGLIRHEILDSNIANHVMHTILLLIFLIEER